MTKREILNSPYNKSQKMRMLFDLGMSRQEVAEAIGVGYGFVQNVYQAYYETGRFATLSSFTFNRNFGVEIEATGIARELLLRKLERAGINTSYNYQSRQNWKIISDGSLSGQDAFEIVSPVLNGEEGLKQLEIVCRVLKENNAQINTSCGLHIHFQASDLKIKGWRNLFTNYAKLESTIDEFMPNSRRGNNNAYAKSIALKPNVYEIIKNCRNLRELQNRVINGNRYHKINTQCYWRQQTVEFRQHSGTIEYDKISNWILFLARLLEYSKTKALSEVNLNKFCTTEIIKFYNNRKAQLRRAS